MVKKALRLPAVLEATGWCKATLYNKIRDKKFPKGIKLDPDGNVVVWWADDVAQYQQRAAEAAEKVAA